MMSQKRIKSSSCLIVNKVSFSFIKPTVLFSISSCVKLVAWALDIYLKIAKLSGLLLRSLTCGIASSISKSIELLTLHWNTLSLGIIVWLLDTSIAIEMKVNSGQKRNSSLNWTELHFGFLRMIKANKFWLKILWNLNSLSKSQALLHISSNIQTFYVTKLYQNDPHFLITTIDHNY